MIITIGGPIGSGKTTVASAIAKKFGFKHISAGVIFREMAKDRGLSLENFSILAEKDNAIDRVVDEKQKALARGGKAVIDGRLSGRFIEGDIKIWLTAPFEMRARRVANRESKDQKKVALEMKKREKSEARRYKEIYNINLNDLSLYDVVLNTALWSAEGVKEIIKTLIEVKS
jgi:cytidylate kinase